ncbi:MAG: hypothetical protein ACOC0M_00125 [Halomonas sp.]
MRSMLAVSLALVSISASAQVNKCNIEGQLSWQSDPCPPGTAVEGSQEREIPERDDATHPDPAYDMAYRTAQAIERTYLSYQRCQQEAPGGCQQFVQRFGDELGPMLEESAEYMPRIAENPAALHLLERHQDDLNEMMQLMRASKDLQRRLNE